MKRISISLLAGVLFSLSAFGQAPPPPAPPVTTNQITLPVISQVQPVNTAAVQLVGNPGPRTIFYWIVANYTVGSTAPAGPFFTTNAPNTFSGSNYVQILPQYPAGVVSLDILKTSSNVQPSASCNCAVATGVTSGAINDQSNSTSSYTVSPIDTTTLALTLQNEVQASGITHLILRQGGVFVADLSAGLSGGIPSAVVAPGAIDFGTVQTGSTSRSVPLAISNTSSTVGLTVVSVTSTNPDFGSPDLTLCNIFLATGGTCPLSVAFTPSTGGAETGSLIFVTNPPVDPATVTIALKGSGTPSATFNVAVTDNASTGSGEVSTGETPPLVDCQIIPGQPISGDCGNSYVTGSTVVLTAQAANGSFSTFGGPCGLTNPCTITVTADTTIPVTFLAPIPNHNLNITGQGQGIGTTISDVAASDGILDCTSTAGVISSAGGTGCSGSFPEGTVLTLTASPLSPSTFVSWSGYPGCGTTPTCVVTLGADTTVTPNFTTSSSTVQLSLTQTLTNAAVSGATVSKAFTGAQLAGDLNICAVSWPDATSTVVSFVDSINGAYTQVPTISPKVGTGVTQALYYFQNITGASAGANVVTATLSTAAAAAVVGSSLTSAHNNGTSSTYSSASVTMPNNSLILATTWAQLNSGNGPGAVLSMTGGGLTWVLVLARNFNSTQGTGTTTRIEVWRALGTGSTGAVTATWNQAVVGRGMSISAFSGVDTSGSNGSGAVGITASNTGSGLTSTVTMGTFGSAANATFGVTGSGQAVSRTAGAGMTQLGADTLVGDEWAASNIASVQQTLGSSAASGSIGIEIKASATSVRRDLRCLEYAGVKQSGSPIDVSAAAVGTSAAPSSGGVTTGTANDLVTGWTYSTTSVNTPSTGYTQRLKDSFGDDEEDQEGVPVGTYTFAPSLTASGNWVASQVALLAQSTSAPTVFSLTLLGGGNGAGLVTSNAGTPNLSGNINNGVCSPVGPCSSSVTASSSVTLTAQPQTGSGFGGWLGITGCSLSLTCIVPNITGNQTVTAIFNLQGVQTYYVAIGGSDSRTAAQAQNPATPWLTCNKAIQSFSLGPGGAVINFTASGTKYAGCIINRGGTSATQPLTLKCLTQWAVGGTNCNFNKSSSSGAFNVTSANFVNIGAVNQFGFEYTNASDLVAVDVVWQCAQTATTCGFGNSIHVFANYLHDIAQSASGPSGVGCPQSGAILAPTQHGHTITGFQAIGNQIDHFGVFPNTFCSEAHGIYVASAGGVVQDNIITRAAAAAIQYYDQGCNATISNNILANSRFGLILYGSNGCTPGVNTAVNNAIVNNTSAGIYTGFSGPSDCSAGRNALFSNNDLFGNATNFNNSQPSCEIRQNPKSENPTTSFVNYTGTASGNYHLNGGSILNGGGTTQCVAGGPTNCIPTLNFSGVGFPTPINIGVY